MQPAWDEAIRFRRGRQRRRLDVRRPGDAPAGKSVVVLEKTGLIGGATASSGGIMWIPNNRFMKEDGVEDSYREVDAYMDATAGRSVDAPGPSAERRRAYVTESSRMVDFLVSQGVKLRRIKYYPDYYDERPGGSEQGRTVIAELFERGRAGRLAQEAAAELPAIPAALDEAAGYRWSAAPGRPSTSPPRSASAPYAPGCSASIG